MGLFRRDKPLSRGRRALRVMVWVIFGVVAGMRWLFPPAQMPMFQNGRMPNGFVVGPEGPGGWRGRREPTPTSRPVSAIPKDLYRLEIEVRKRDVEILRGYFWNGFPGRGGGGGGGGERPEVQATVREGGVTYTNVALHLKGSAGSFRPFDDKPAMTLNFGKHAKGQTFHGYSKISLNNSVQDPTYLSEAVCREMFVAAGVPAPRIEHATVVLNGRDLDLYVVSEGWGKPFLRRFFTNPDGHLYEGGFLRDLTEELDINSGDEKEGRGDLDRLVAAAGEPDARKRWERLNQTLDVDRFLTFLALEVMTCHWDGYSLNRNNYRVFHDRSTGKMVFLPHGLDQTFGTGRSSPNASIMPGMEGLVARAVTGTAEGRKRYMERIASLRSTVFQEQALTNRLWELARKLQPTLTAYSPERATWHQNEVADFAGRMVERARSISEQLKSPLEAIPFDAQGIARISGWRPGGAGGNRGTSSFARETSDEAKLLKIKSNSAGAVGSWRTRVLLEPGRYRLEGRVRAIGVGEGGGVCLRLSGVRIPARPVQGEDWQTLTFGFVVGEMLSEVELICELRANGGEALFDEASLRLVREE